MPVLSRPRWIGSKPCCKCKNYNRPIIANDTAAVPNYRRSENESMLVKRFVQYSNEKVCRDSSRGVCHVSCHTRQQLQLVGRRMKLQNNGWRICNAHRAQLEEECTKRSNTQSNTDAHSRTMAVHVPLILGSTATWSPSAWHGTFSKGVH